MTQNEKPFKSFMGKGENADNQHFLLFLQCFVLYLENKSSFESTLEI